MLAVCKVAAISKTAVSGHPARAQLGLQAPAVGYQNISVCHVIKPDWGQTLLIWVVELAPSNRTLAFSAVPRKPRPPAPAPRGPPLPALSKERPGSLGNAPSMLLQELNTTAMG
jgi:hypothetical protein